MKKLLYKPFLLAFIFSLHLVGFSLSHATQVNTMAPDFSLKLLNQSKEIKLSDYSGKVIYLDFWASWCAPCRTSFPLLNELHRKYKDKGFEVVAINLDDELDSVKKFNSLCPVDFTLLRDEDNSAPQAYQVKAMPSSYIIDKKGNIRHIHTGFKKSDITTIELQVIKLLAENN